MRPRPGVRSLSTAVAVVGTAPTSHGLFAIAASTGMAAILSGSRVVHTKPVGRCGGPQGMISSGVT